jgi:MED6 mediator sub complex component
VVLKLPKISSIQFLLDVSLGLNSPLYMLKQLSHTLYSSFTNESVSLPRKVSRNSQAPLPPQESHVILSTARPLQAYFIINNRIYQSPDMYTVLSNRLARTTVPNPMFSPMLTGGW